MPRPDRINWWMYPLFPLATPAEFHRRWRHFLLMPITFLAFVFLLAATTALLTVIFAIVVPVGICYLPFAIYNDSVKWKEEGRFYNRLRPTGRVVAWKDVEPRLRAGLGTLIVEQGDFGIESGMPDRIWWTLESVLDAAPIPPPSVEQLDTFAFYQPHEFVTYCYQRYLDPDVGIALLIEKPPLPAKPDAALRFHDAGGRGRYFKRCFPNLCVVDTVYYRFPTCLKCGYDLRATFDRCPECGKPVPLQVDNKPSNRQVE